ncbi:MAG TPA: hypothetical protein VK898_19380 [Chloroflexota bacterium]|nr:hypothetical protein [Chloroflexota bacterium]
MRFDVQLSRSAERYLERLPRDVQRRVVSRLDQIGEDPFAAHTKPLAGPGGRRAARRDLPPPMSDRSPSLRAHDEPP